VIRLLICDDSASSRAALRTVIEDDESVEVVGEAADGAEAVALAQELAPDVVLMDVSMPVLDGIGATARIRELVPDARVIALTAHDESEVVTAMIEAGASSYCLKGAPLLALRRAITAVSGRGYADERVVPTVFEEVVRLYQQQRSAVDQLARANEELMDQTQKLGQLGRGVVRALAGAVEARDRYTGGHVDRVSRYALLLTQRIAPQLAGDPRVEYGYVLHDVGKIGVPDSILTKEGPLDDDEWELVRRHPEIGERICAPLRSFGAFGPIIRHHHERWDGTGYPGKLRGEGIPIGARIVGLVDAFDAITHDRPYRAARSLEQALDELGSAAGRQFDPDLTRLFVDEVARLSGQLPDPPLDTFALFARRLRPAGPGLAPAHRLAPVPGA